MMYSLSCISSQIPFAFTAFDLHPSGNHMHTASEYFRHTWGKTSIGAKAEIRKCISGGIPQLPGRCHCKRENYTRIIPVFNCRPGARPFLKAASVIFRACPDSTLQIRGGIPACFPEAVPYSLRKTPEAIHHTLPWQETFCPQTEVPQSR